MSFSFEKNFAIYRVFASVTETVQINLPFLGNFDLYTVYLHFFQSYLKLFNSQIFPNKILKIVFCVIKLESVTKFKKLQ